jgi:hypothetical protein
VHFTLAFVARALASGGRRDFPFSIFDFRGFIGTPQFDKLHHLISH